MTRRLLCLGLVCGALGCSGGSDGPTTPGPSTTAFTTSVRVTDALSGPTISGVTATGDGVSGSASSLAGTMTVGGAASNRITAKAVMTKVAALMLTPKCRASCGRTGATTPYPRAMIALAVISDHTSRGSRAGAFDALTTELTL